MAHTSSADRLVVRQTAGIVASIAFAALAVFLIVDAGVRGGWALALLYTPWVLLVLWLIYTSVGASRIDADADGVTVQNVLRVRHIPWPCVERVVMGMQVEVVLRSGRTVSCMAGPMVARPGRPLTRLGQARASDGEAVVEALRQRQARAASRESADARVSASWDWPLIIACGVFSVGAGIAVVAAAT